MFKKKLSSTCVPFPSKNEILSLKSIQINCSYSFLCGYTVFITIFVALRASFSPTFGFDCVSISIALKVGTRKEGSISRLSLSSFPLGALQKSVQVRVHAPKARKKGKKKWKTHRHPKKRVIKRLLANSSFFFSAYFHFVHLVPQGSKMMTMYFCHDSPQSCFFL